MNIKQRMAAVLGSTSLALSGASMFVTKTSTSIEILVASGILLGVASVLFIQSVQPMKVCAEKEEP